MLKRDKKYYERKKWYCWCIACMWLCNGLQMFLDGIGLIGVIVFGAYPLWFCFSDAFKSNKDDSISEL